MNKVSAATKVVTTRKKIIVVAKKSKFRHKKNLAIFDFLTTYGFYHHSKRSVRIPVPPVSTPSAASSGSLTSVPDPQGEEVRAGVGSGGTSGSRFAGCSGDADSLMPRSDFSDGEVSDTVIGKPGSGFSGDVSVSFPVPTVLEQTYRLRMALTFLE